MTGLVTEEEEVKNPLSKLPFSPTNTELSA